MAEFLSSLAEEIEALQHHVAVQHTHMLNRLRTRHAELTAGGMHQVYSQTAVCKKELSWSFLQEEPSTPRQESTCSKASPKISSNAADLQVPTMQLSFTGSLDVPLQDQEQGKGLEKDLDEYYTGSTCDEGADGALATFVCQAEVEDEDCSDLSRLDNMSENISSKSRTVFRWTHSLKMAPRQEWDLKTELGNRSLHEDVMELLCSCIETRGAEMLQMIRTPFEQRRTSMSSTPFRSIIERGMSRDLKHTTEVESTFLPPFNPYSFQRLLWDTVGAAFVLYEIVFIPLVLFVFSFRDCIGGTIVELAGNVYWTVDIFLNFLTCVDIGGEMQRDFKTIAKHYGSRWFIIDLLIILPEWIGFYVQSSPAGITLFRVLKISRVLRLLRVVRIGSAVRKHLSRFNSSRVLNLLRLVQMMLAFFMLNHFVACIWYFIGNQTSDGWLSQRSDSDHTSAGYALALHWAVSQFHGTSDIVPVTLQERIFAVSMQFAGLLTLSIFVSATTKIILQDQQSRQHFNERMEKLRKFFLRHSVSAQAMMRVKSCFMSADNENEWTDDLDVLKGVPDALLKRVLAEARSPIIDRHCLFTWLKTYHGAAFRTMCHSGFQTFHSMADSVVFETGDAWEKIIFIEDGHLTYMESREPSSRSTRLRKSSSRMLPVTLGQVGLRLTRHMWLCELALWVKGWQSKGDFVAQTHSSLLCLSSAALAQELDCFPEARIEVLMYSHGFLQEVITEGLEVCMLNDLWKHA